MVRLRLSHNATSSYGVEEMFRANEALMEGRAAEALDLYTQILYETCPGNVCAFLNRSLAYIALGYPELAATDAYRAADLCQQVRRMYGLVRKNRLSDNAGRKRQKGRKSLSDITPAPGEKSIHTESGGSSKARGGDNSANPRPNYEFRKVLAWAILPARNEEDKPLEKVARAVEAYLRAEKDRIDAEEDWTQTDWGYTGREWLQTEPACVVLWDQTTWQEARRPFEMLEVKAMYRLCGALWECGNGAISDAMGLISDLISFDRRRDSKWILTGDEEGSFTEMGNEMLKDSLRMRESAPERMDALMKMKATMANRVLYPWNHHVPDMDLLEVQEELKKFVQKVTHNCAATWTEATLDTPFSLNLFAMNDIPFGSLIFAESCSVVARTQDVRHILSCDTCGTALRKNKAAWYGTDDSGSSDIDPKFDVGPIFDEEARTEPFSPASADMIREYIKDPEKDGFEEATIDLDCYCLPSDENEASRHSMLPSSTFQDIDLDREPHTGSPGNFRQNAHSVENENFFDTDGSNTQCEENEKPQTPALSTERFWTADLDEDSNAASPEEPCRDAQNVDSDTLRSPKRRRLSRSPQKASDGPSSIDSFSRPCHGRASSMYSDRDLLHCPRCHAVAYCSRDCEELGQSFHEALCGRQSLSDHLKMRSAFAQRSYAKGTNEEIVHPKTVYLHQVLLARIFALSKCKDKHPLDIDEVKWLNGELCAAPSIFCKATAGFSNDLPSMEAKRLPWSFSDNIVAPEQTLLGMNIKAWENLELYDGWVLNTLFAKVMHSARITHGFRFVKRYDALGTRIDSFDPKHTKDWPNDKDCWVATIHPVLAMADTAYLEVYNGSCKPNCEIRENEHVWCYALPSPTVDTSTRSKGEGSMAKPGDETATKATDSLVLSACTVEQSKSGRVFDTPQTSDLVHDSPAAGAQMPSSPPEPKKPISIFAGDMLVRMLVSGESVSGREGASWTSSEWSLSELHEDKKARASPSHGEPVNSQTCLSANVTSWLGHLNIRSHSCEDASAATHGPTIELKGAAVDGVTTSDDQVKLASDGRVHGGEDQFQIMPEDKSDSDDEEEHRRRLQRRFEKSKVSLCGEGENVRGEQYEADEASFFKDQEDSYGDAIPAAAYSRAGGQVRRNLPTGPRSARGLGLRGGGMDIRKTSKSKYYSKSAAPLAKTSPTSEQRSQVLGKRRRLQPQPQPLSQSPSRDYQESDWAMADHGVDIADLQARVAGFGGAELDTRMGRC